jgi:hypothetical protein
MPAGFAIAFLLWSTPAGAGILCPVAEIVSPARGSLVAQPRPVIEWRELAGVTRYRVQLESRVPEGRSLARYDTVVAGTRFAPPGNLTDFRAAVKLLVTPECKVETQSVAETGAWFFMDVSGLCPAPDAIRADTGASPVLSWAPVKQARRYEVTVYTASEGRLLAIGESLEPRFRFAAAPGVSYYAAMRVRCPEAYSAPVYSAVIQSR